MKRPLSYLLLPLALAAAAGCSSAGLNSARSEYFQGRYQEAAVRLENAEVPDRDRALFLMERGMIRQAAGDYTNSIRDLIEAYNIIDSQVALSISQDAGSMLINDNVQDYDGVPFERTHLHVFTALAHLQVRNWENAGVEARRIIESLKPEVRKDYPEDAFSRYMAGFCLWMAGDTANAGLQYRLAAALRPSVPIDDRTGLLGPTIERASAIWPSYDYPYELVVFALIGRSPSGEELYNHRRPVQPAGYADVTVNGSAASGRSHELADIVDLAFTTEQKEALRKMAKTMSRIAIKEATADSLDDNNPLIGALYRIIMIGLLEQPDVRRWETLPRSLQIARIPLETVPEQVTVTFRSATGAPLRTITGGIPAANNGRTFIMLVRDTQPVL